MPTTTRVFCFHYERFPYSLYGLLLSILAIQQQALHYNASTTTSGRAPLQLDHVEDPYVRRLPHRVLVPQTGSPCAS